MIGLRINRNILECKDQLKRILFWFANGINRNILECKGTTFACPGRRAVGINRNILECKGMKQGRLLGNMESVSSFV